MRLDVITIFPGYLEPLRHALIGKAIEKDIVSVGVHDLRDWAHGVHKAVDDSPYGGGPGMVMKPDVWADALEAVLAGNTPIENTLTSVYKHKDSKRHDDLAVDRGELQRGESSYADVVKKETETGSGPSDKDKPLLIVPTPTGEPFTQKMAQELSFEDHIVFACGRYEGIDQRVFEEEAANYRIKGVSIGDYVLVGGEVAVLTMAEAIVRLIPGVLGNRESHEQDSFSDGLLEGPCYTKPRQWRGREVPEVLTTGNHKKIEEFRREQSLAITATRRPDLIDKCEAEGQLTDKDREFLKNHHGFKFES